MHEKSDRERWDDEDSRRSIRIPGPELGRPVVVALRDAWTRIEVTAGLVLAGYRVRQARTLRQLTALASATDIVVADGPLVERLGGAAHEALRRIILIAVCEQGAPTPLAARARFTPPVDVDGLVNAVAMLGRRH